MAVLGDELEAVEVGAHLRHVVDHRGNPEDRRMTPVVLKSNGLKTPVFFLCQIEIEILLRFYVLNVDFMLSGRTLCAKYVRGFTTSAKHQT